MGIMPFEITNQGTHLVVSFHGFLKPQDLVQLADEVEAIEDALPSGLDRISDLSAVTDFDIGFPEVRVLAARRRMRTFARTLKSAIVAPSPVQMGMARMFQSLNDNPQIEIRIVASMQEALHWLSESPVDVTPPRSEKDA